MSNQSPNILLIIADDLSPSSLKAVNTPHINELAEDGIVFENAWATPECSPTRATIATGRYGFRTGVGNAIGSGEPGLSTNEVTIAEALDANPQLGYSETVIGKWHLGSENNNNAIKQGYDYYAGNESGALRDYYSWTKIVASDTSSRTIRQRVSDYATTETVDDAIGWLDGDKTNVPDLDQPWFLQLAFNAPHTPYHKPPEDLLIDSEYINLSGTSEDIEANPEPYFNAAIQALDTETGRLFEYLDSQGELEDTVIVFIGDNGSPTEVAKDPDRAKSTLYEGGIKIPMIVSGNGVVRGDGTEDSLVNTTDLFATVLELAGSNYEVPKDSVSLVPYLKNQAHPNEREWAFSEYFDESNDNASGSRGSNYGQTIRNEDYKLIRFDQDGREEFYTLGPLGEFDERSQSELLQGNVNNLTPTQRDNYEFLADQIDALNNSQLLNNSLTNLSSELVENNSLLASDSDVDKENDITGTVNNEELFYGANEDPLIGSVGEDTLNKSAEVKTSIATEGDDENLVFNNGFDLNTVLDFETIDISSLKSAIDFMAGFSGIAEQFGDQNSIDVVNSEVDLLASESVWDASADSFLLS